MKLWNPFRREPIRQPDVKTSDNAAKPLDTTSIEGPLPEHEITVELPNLRSNDYWKELKAWIEPMYGKVNDTRTFHLQRKYPGHPKARSVNSYSYFVRTNDVVATFDQIWKFIRSDIFIYDFQRYFPGADVVDVCKVTSEFLGKPSLSPEFLTLLDNEMKAKPETCQACGGNGSQMSGGGGRQACRWCHGSGIFLRRPVKRV
jgi:hypothetical protein